MLLKFLQIDSLTELPDHRLNGIKFNDAEILAVEPLQAKSVRAKETLC
jgi:hypothetical protein